MDAAAFDDVYRDTPPWDIGRPQRDVVALAEAGGIRGRVLDVGCGTGENALLLAARGHAVVGVDGSPRAVAKARAKAEARGVSAEFLVADALALPALGTFDTILDSGLFHIFDDEDRPRYARQVAAALKPGGAFHMLVWSDREPPDGGPRRVSEREIRDTFQGGWRVEAVRPATYETLIHGERPGAHAWLATMRRRESESVSSTAGSRS